MKIAITGATGFVGTGLVEKLLEKENSLLILTRNAERCKRIFPSTVYPNLEILPYTATESGLWQERISGCDAVINLAGEPIAERWTSEYKKAILESRQLGTQKIVEAIAKAAHKPSVLISASAIGYYGSSETATFDENSSPGNDFLAQVCQSWESEAQKVTSTETRLVILRIGIVLGKGGALSKMLPVFKLFAGGPIGTGQQWFSWIHRADLINLIILALEHPEIKGVFNATSPNPVRMSNLCDSLGKAINRPSWLPVPSFALELLLGEGAQVVLEGQQVLPKATSRIGFTYQYPELNAALREIVK
jgi:uncharacterized protein